MKGVLYVVGEGASRKGYQHMISIVGPTHCCLIDYKNKCNSTHAVKLAVLGVAKINNIEIIDTRIL